MAKDNSVWRGNWGRISITALIAAAIGSAIWKKGDAFGLTSNGLKLLVFVAVIILLLLVRHGKTISLAIKQQWSRFQAKRKNVLPVDEGRVEQTAPRNVTVDTIRDAMRNLYGRRWGRKTRILLITGTVTEVEQLTPGLTAQLWQEDRGTLLLWGGELTYVNQLPAWKRFSWPADTEAPGANLSWISTQAGTRQYADIPGAWGWIRLLDKTAVKAYPGVGSSYSLSWKAQDGRKLNYTLRTEAGEGPLALLKLRNFRLPETIFSTTGPALSDQVASAGNDAEEVY